ncbi:type II secretion system F family protein [Yoonia vestfoldensis]|uniref:Type II/IV secretion system protein, TadC subfamily n=1 Tax=Yoonia vestfoldensis SKA53 TaxID=314232 RepID=A3V7B6_9RHOB|nr:type II secretion system F family protein [Yoonia vestfoldensis]EAQ06132.1 type II/IV secretion system protein, TadC subfamily [Yoonia vestfoldensis SKA53]
MQAIQTLIIDILGPFGPLMVIGLVGFFMILLTLPVVFRRKQDPLDRLKAANRPTNKTERLRAASSKDTLEKYSNFLEPQNAAEYSAVKLKLLQSGYRSKNAVRIYHFVQFALGITGLFGGGIYSLIEMAQRTVNTQELIMMILVPGGIGYMFPKYWVTRRVEVRKEAIINAFPDSLDLMLVCVEAGQSLDQSILRVSNELRTGFPELAEEFEIVSQEAKAGKDKTTVLKDMAERCGVPDISSFVTVMVQSAQFGTSISDALRVYASEMRDKRVMRAEEAANKLPTKMTLATMMLTVPPLMAILIGPSIYAITTSLG